MIKIQLEISIGEAVDKLSILIIKKNKISCKSKLEHIQNEISSIEKSICHIDFKLSLDEIMPINEKLWEINDKRKKMIEIYELNEEFIELSIQESKINDTRFKIKQKIDIKFESYIQEQKSYNWA